MSGSVARERRTGERRTHGFGPRRRGAASELAARLSTAALRVSDPRLAPVAVAARGAQILVHEGARQAIERRLREAFEGAVQLAVHLPRPRPG